MDVLKGKELDALRSKSFVKFMVLYNKFITLPLWHMFVLRPPKSPYEDYDYGNYGIVDLSFVIAYFTVFGISWFAYIFTAMYGSIDIVYNVLSFIFPILFIIFFPILIIKLGIQMYIERKYHINPFLLGYNSVVEIPQEETVYTYSLISDQGL